MAVDRTGTAWVIYADGTLYKVRTTVRELAHRLARDHQPCHHEAAVVGPYDKVKARAEMTGTGDGKLFAAFKGSPYVVAEIDKPTANVLSLAPQTQINYPPNGSNFAFAFWGGDFWLFVGPGSSTDVFQYDPTKGTTIKVSSEAFEIVGAGVSTCAPTVHTK
jgi:hypothetical protein